MWMLLKSKLTGITVWIKCEKIGYNPRVWELVECRRF